MPIKDTVTVVVTRNVGVAGESCKPGDKVKVSKRDANYLVGIKKAKFLKAEQAEKNTDNVTGITLKDLADELEVAQKDIKEFFKEMDEEAPANGAAVIADELAEKVRTAVAEDRAGEEE